MISLLTSLLTLFGLIINEYFSAKAQARQREKEFKLDQLKFRALVTKAIYRQTEDTSKLTGGAKIAWDLADQILKK